LVFVTRLKYLVTRHAPLVLCILTFTISHSLVAHKEERFIYPIFGLVLIALAYVWSLNRYDSKTKKVYRPAFWFVTLVVLPVACFVNSQAGEIEPAAIAEQELGQVAYIEHRSLFSISLIQFYFLRPPSQIFPVNAEDLTLGRAEAVLEKHPELKGAVFLTSETSVFDRLRSLAQQTSAHLRCGEARVATSLVDRLLYRLNPKHNQRRRPTLYILCGRQ